MSPVLGPPVAGERAHSSTHHGITIEDPWHWLRDPGYPDVEDPDVLAYLNAENAFFETSMAPQQELIDAIFEEIKGRQQPDLSSVPWRRGNCNYGSLLAYGTDTDGSERFRMVVRDLGSGEMLDDEIAGTMGSAVWAADDGSFFYTLVDENWRPWQVRRHVMGQPVTQDAVVYEETDPGFFVGLSNTTSREFILIGSGDHVTSEVWLIPATAPESAPLVVSPRRTGHEYSVDHQGDRFVIRTNDTHKNSRLATAQQDDPSERTWTPLVDASDEHYTRAFKTFRDFIAVEERISGLDHIRLVNNAGETTYVQFPESAYRSSGHQPGI
ncbi:Dipeptidyl aminopeptidase BI [Geodia barretti]|uniref:Dipeptidyl aminopeptidase BI n=1 Tax=Geodia barretti TaxID=519541 RepID=A0AA35RJ12_GEOBA|nr:Dipeptidyl aminopeptidase BI [Geodia barretti]